MRIYFRYVIEILFVVIYFLIIFLSLKSSFLHMQNVDVQFGDGKFYLLLEIICLFYIVKGISITSGVYNSTFPILFFILFQLYFLYIAGMPMTYILRLVSWGIVFMGIYYYTLIYKIESLINLFSIALTILSIYTLYCEVDIRQLEHHTGINEVYWILLGLPLIYICKSMIIKYTMTVAIIFATFMSMKATGILAISIGFLFAEWTRCRILNRGLKPFIKLLLFTTVAYILFILINDYLVSTFGLNWLEKYEVSTSTGGSGRYAIWNQTMGLIYNSSFFNFIFGHGHNALIGYLGFSAHNDFIEVLYDYGLIMFIIYISIYVRLFKEAYRMIVYRSKLAPAFVLSIVLFCVLSMFSHLIIYPGLMVNLGVIWAICLSEFRINSNEDAVS